jgi:PAS domain S-box-containing protein
MGVILIAYERESEQAALEQLLTARGHQVVRAANGLTALDAARREPPHLIVADIVLPRMDGFALCRKWKQDERLQSVPFFFYTRRHDDPKYERFALELGAQRFFARTAQPDALLNAIDELVPRAARSGEALSPSLDAAARRAQEQDRAQRVQQLALERAQQTQNALSSQIAELEATNQRLVAGEARFRQLFEANPLPMWIADRATNGFIAVNNAALTLYGYSRAEFLGLTAQALLRESATATSGNGVLAHRNKSGGSLDVALTAREMEFDGRNADLVCAVDLGDQVAREQQLQAQCSTQSAIINAIADGCLVLDGDGRILEVNDAYCRMSGYSRDALRRMNAADLEQQEPGETTIRLQLGRYSGDGRYETKHKRSDGSLIDVELNIGKMQHASADSVVVIRDVSQHRRELIGHRMAQRQMQFLIDLYRKGEAFDEAAIMRRLVDHAVEATRSPLAYFYLVNQTVQTITLSAWRDRAAAQAALVHVEPRSLASAGQFAECVRSRQSVLSNAPFGQPLSDGLPELQGFLAVPLLVAGEVVAVLGVANREADYDQEDQRMLSSLADDVGLVLQARRTHAQTLGSLQRADVAMQAMIDALLHISELHSPHTAGSARRVAALAVALGREAGLDGERQHSLRVAALLRDIGNVAVPAVILAKPSRFTELEMSLVQTHVEASYQLLTGIDFGAPIADIVRAHHERIDGSGYPRALQGDAIPLEARILAIADTVTAMCSPRPHRSAVDINVAIDEINRAAGSLFDAALVEACTRLVRQQGFTFPTRE